VIQVWLHAIALDEAGAASRAACLSAPEIGRAQRYVHDIDRQRFIAARAGLRHVLGRHCGVDPAALEFAYGPHGRPVLRRPVQGPDFNLSHSRDFAAVAVSDDCQVGLDVEVVKPFDPHYRELAGYALGERERAQLAACPAGLRAETFLRFWTGKEAFLKMHGMGLTIEPSAVLVDLGAGVVGHGDRIACLAFPGLAPGVIAALATPQAAGWRIA
jgi:4'-phosphopantetheinyl transferase